MSPRLSPGALAARPPLGLDPRRPAHPGAFVALQVAALDVAFGAHDLEQLLEAALDAGDLVRSAAGALLTLAGAL